MKENPYDNEQFFKKYSEMLRSKKGLAGAGEWSELKNFSQILTGAMSWIWDAGMDGIVSMLPPTGHPAYSGRIFPQE